MSAAAALIVAAVLTASLLKCGDAIILAHHTTVEFKCSTNGDHTPDWLVNGIVAVTTGDSYRSRTSNGRDITATLTIDGNGTQVTFNIHCEVYEENQFLSVHSTTVTFQGFLASPEDVFINSSTIEWKPPYSFVNNDTVHVDPHITQYTVYITDNYTGDSIVEKNVTETKYVYTFNIQNDGPCLMYQVTAWNSGGEGEMSEPAQDSTPRVPRSIAVENITVVAAVDPKALHILVDVDVVCTSRMPEFFLITVMTSTGNALNETRQHQPGRAVANFTITLPPSVNVCSLHVRIRAGNSAGMSAPSETVEVDCSGDSTDSTTTASATTVLTVTSTGSGSEGNSQQGNRTTLIVTITIGVIAAVGVTLIVAVGIICCFKHKSKNSKVKHSNQTDNNYTESPSLGGPVPLYKPPVAEAVYVTTEQTTSRPVVRDPEYTAVWMQTLDSAPSTLQTSVAIVPEVQTQTSFSPKTSTSTVSGGSDDLLLPLSPPVPASRPNQVYAQVNVQQTQVPPPANDDHVQYAQIKQQDTM